MQSVTPSALGDPQFSGLSALRPVAELFRRQPSAIMADQTPLTNADFRKLLQTPRRDAATPSGQPGATPRREGQKSKKPNYKPKPTNAEGEDGEPKYR